jgi:transposase
VLKVIILNSKAQLTVDVIAKVADSRITVANAAKLLNKSTRTIERYLQRYRTNGIQFIVHGNTGSEPANKTSGSLKRKIHMMNHLTFPYQQTSLIHTMTD